MEYPHLISNKVFFDERGTFAPLSLKYDNSIFEPLKKNWIQSNISVNPAVYTLRGLHFQVGDKAQSKLVKVINGSIYDFVVDIREDSPNYLKHYIFDMSPGDDLYVPRGFAHGFLTQETNTVVQYLVDNDYSPESEGSIYYKDIDVLYQDIKSRFDYDFERWLVISEKDTKTKNFNFKEYDTRK